MDAAVVAYSTAKSRLESARAELKRTTQELIEEMKRSGCVAIQVGKQWATLRPVKPLSAEVLVDSLASMDHGKLDLTTALRACVLLNGKYRLELRGRAPSPQREPHRTPLSPRTVDLGSGQRFRVMEKPKNLTLNTLLQVLEETVRTLLCERGVTAVTSAAFLEELRERLPARIEAHGTNELHIEEVI